MDKATATAAIRKAIRQGGNYCNNIVGATLRTYANEHGTDAADDLIRELKLGKLLGIMTEPERLAEKEKWKGR